MNKTLLAAVVSLAGWVGFAAAQSPPAKAPDAGLDHPPCEPLPADTAPCPRWWGSAEYLFWVTKDAPLPIPLITSGPSVGNLRPAFGQQVVIGGENIDSKPQSGGRFILGAWIDPERNLGVEGSYFFLSQNTNNALAVVPGPAVLAVPFADATNGLESALQLSGPGTNGMVQTMLRSRLWGVEANLRGNVLSCCNWQFGGLLGFRALGLDDTFEITAATVNPPNLAPSSLFQDRFATRNRFFGGQVGVVAEWHCGRWFVELSGKFALGNTHEQLEVGGNHLVGGVAGVGGIFAQQTNMPGATRDQLSFVADTGVNLGYQVTDYLRAYVGYSVLYWTDTLRPGEQIDRTINPTQLRGGTLVGPLRPAPQFKGTDFWAQGLNVGLELRY